MKKIIKDLPRPYSGAGQIPTVEMTLYVHKKFITELPQRQAP